MGIFVVDSAGERCYGHEGFWGTQTIHCPRLDITFGRTINQADNSDFDYDALETVIVDAAQRLAGTLLPLPCARNQPPSSVRSTRKL